MICYHCEKASGCQAFRTLHSMSKNFSINDCRAYEGVSKYKYRKIAQHDELLHLIYDYFTGQVEGGFSDEEVKRVITNEIWSL